MPAISGTYLCEYVGEVVSKQRFEERMRYWYTRFDRHYALGYTSGFVIDAYRAGSLARFVNHSCQPNCDVQKWTVNGQHRIVLVSNRRLAAGEEITYNYRFHSYGRGLHRCLCAADNCTGKISTMVIRNEVTPPTTRTPSPKETAFTRQSRLYLLRNWTRIRRHRFTLSDNAELSKEAIASADLLLRQSYALLCSGKTLKKRHSSEKQLQKLLLNIVDQLCTSDAFQKVTKCKEQPTDAALKNIRRAIVAEKYKSPDVFDRDIRKLLQKYKSSSDVSDLMNVYMEIKLSQLSSIEELLVEDWKSDKFVAIEETKKNSEQQECKSEDGRLLTTKADLSYLDEDEPIRLGGDEEEAWQARATEEEDWARCVCGISEEDGEMIQCDRCRYWLHLECCQDTAPKTDVDEFVCQFCSSGRSQTPAVDVPQRPQPELRLPNCRYYRALVDPASGLQVRLNECVYVLKKIDDRHKLELKLLHEECVKGSKTGKKNSSAVGKTCANDQRTSKEYSRKDVRVFRVERLFAGPTGQRFVFGCYYARPHETFCEPSRLFYKNEVG